MIIAFISIFFLLKKGAKSHLITIRPAIYERCPCLLYLDYFMKEMGPFTEIFANLESMNKAVSNALVESAKVCTITTEY